MYDKLNDKTADSHIHTQAHAHTHTYTKRKELQELCDFLRDLLSGSLCFFFLVVYTILNISIHPARVSVLRVP